MKNKTCVLFAALAMSIVAFSGIAWAGELTVYTSLEEDDAKVYLDAFAKVEPDIKVNMLRLSTGDLGARMLAEKSNPQHDIIWGWAVTQMVDPRIMEMLEAYKSEGHRQGEYQLHGSRKQVVRHNRLFCGFLCQHRCPEEEKPADAKFMAGSVKPGLQRPVDHAQPGQFGYRLFADFQYSADEGRGRRLEISA